MSYAKNITLKELQKLIGARANVRVVDVRSASEYKERHIPIAEHFPVDKIEAGEFEPKGDEIVITACGSGGGRSERSAKLISQKIQREVYYLDGGTFGWFKDAELNQAVQDTPFQKFLKTGHLSTDSESDKIKKSSLLIMAFPFALAGIVWGCLYFYNGMSLPGWIPFSYGILSLISVGCYLIWKEFKFFRFSQILLILLLPFALQLSLGGFILSSSVIIWALISPLGALVFYDIKQSRYWFAAFVLLLIIAFVFNDYLPSYVKPDISENFINRLFLMNVLGVSFLIYFMQYYFVGKQSDLKKAVEVQSDEIAQKNKEITDSINYARRIQFTLMAHNDVLKKSLTEHFVLFRPKDIVSGDFYWATNRGDKFYLAVCDSTGHGVPGAFMSLLNISFLNEAINEKGIILPNEICNYVRQKLIDNISQDGSQDGMDGILLCWDRHEKVLSFAAAHNSPFLVRGNTGQELGADKMPIGKGERLNGFRLTKVQMQEGDKFYLFTDGYADQFGGPKGKKFKYRQLQELLVSLSDVSFDEQKRVIEAIHNEWRGNLDQTDDILVIGLKV